MRALILAADFFEDLELFYPYYRLIEENIDVMVSSSTKEAISGKHGYEITPDLTFTEALEDVFDLIIIPGGRAPERIRLDEKALDIVKRVFASNAPVAAICHGPQVLISADVISGRMLTCYKGIKDDVIAAGGNYFDKEVVVDGNLVTSRSPEDLPYFFKGIKEVMRI
jgi:protease I